MKVIIRENKKPKIKLLENAGSCGNLKYCGVVFRKSKCLDKNNIKEINLKQVGFSLLSFIFSTF